jgi:two-component system chemotaxis response regulator CheB
MHPIIRVLVVDDSAFVRKVVTQMLSRSPFIEVVGIARDGREALEQVEQLRPDVVTLDLMMPVMNGLEFLREQMARGPVPVVLCSIADESGETALEALDAGAVEFIQKPTALATEKVYEIADELIAKVKAAANVKPRPARASVRPEPPIAGSPKATHATRVMVIGISTGGPQALRQLIPQLSAGFPVPIAMVLHMPVGYTEMYAQRLDAISGLHVVEAKDGEVLLPGTAYLAPAGRHLSFVRDATGIVRTHLDIRPLDARHRPSVDVLFESAANIFGTGVLGIVMTGMGNDGMEGSAHIKAQGGRVITEAESSCVVYGMPRAVVDAGLSDRTSALEEMAQTIVEML